MAGAFAKTGEPRTWVGRPRDKVEEAPKPKGVGPGLQEERISIAGTIMVDTATAGATDQSDEQGRSPFSEPDISDEATA